MKVCGNIVDILNRVIYPAELIIKNQRIESIHKTQNRYSNYILPGFIDSHIHIESTMLIPEEFSKIATRYGTVAVINDPHEIANVLGREGVEWWIDRCKRSDIKIFSGIPSCVPATKFDKAGGTLDLRDIFELAQTGDFIVLSEMMNVPGVLQREKLVIDKLRVAKEFNMKVDGHAPGLRGDDLKEYVANGITSDHESIMLEEAEEKIDLGMHVMIREGSAAKNLDTLQPLISSNTDKVMFCSDDSHPDDLLKYGHIDKMVRRSIERGYDIFDVLQVACVNPVHYYGLPVGLLQVNDPADFVVVNNLTEFKVESIYINGKEICHENTPHLYSDDLPNKFYHDPITITDLKCDPGAVITAIEIVPNELITGKKRYNRFEKGGNFESDLENDILKIVYINRYINGKPQIGYISGFNLKEGAFASSVSHDSHNIIAVGCSDIELVEVINKIISMKGGLAVKSGGYEIMTLPLPVGGIVSDRSGEEVATCYRKLKNMIAKMGSTLHDPFMTLSFMALIVIPAYKIGEKGVFDYETFSFVSDRE